MNENIINKYQLRFQNKIFDFEVHGKEIRKIIQSNVPILDEFLSDWNANEITDYLLQDTEDVLMEQQKEISNGSETVMIILHLDEVDFYPNNGDIVSIPTEDFKEIVLGWQNFLLAPPLNGAKVNSGGFFNFKKLWSRLKYLTAKLF